MFFYCGIYCVYEIMAFTLVCTVFTDAVAVIGHSNALTLLNHWHLVK